MTAFGDNAILFINKIKKAAFSKKAAPKTLLSKKAAPKTLLSKKAAPKTLFDGLHIILKLYILFTFLVRLCGFFST
jgi:hypothetical protein